MEIPRILCCIPSYDGPDPRPFMHFLLLAAECGKAEAVGKYKVRWNVGGPRVKTQTVRNSACQYALLGNCTHLAFIDDDMLVPPDILESLLRSDKPIIAPIFFRGGIPPDPLAFALDGTGEPFPMYNYPVDKVFPAPGGVGTGVMLLRTEVLAAMQDDSPWFRYPYGSARSMDVDFCMRAASKGFVSHCDSRLLVEQLGLSQPIGRSQWETHRRMEKQYASA